jgi:hypothetical protein
MSNNTMIAIIVVLSTATFYLVGFWADSFIGG